MSHEQESVYECEEGRDLAGRCIPTNDQRKCRYVYYSFLRTGVYQFDPISNKEKHFKLFKQDEDFFNKRYDQFLWTDDRYLIVSSTYSGSSKMEIHFFEIQKEGLKLLSSLQFSQMFNCFPVSSIMPTTYPRYPRVLFVDGLSGVIFLWCIDTEKWLTVNMEMNNSSSTTSILRFLDEHSFLSVHDKPGIVCYWKILKDRVERSWKFEDKTLINSKTTQSIHSDKIIILREEANFLAVIDIAAGREVESIPNPNGADRKICVLSKINDDQILLGDSDGDGYSRGDMFVYNIRTAKIEYKLEKKSSFPFDPANPRVFERFISLSPTQILVEGCSKKGLLSMEKNGILRGSDFYSFHREYGLAHVVNLGNGYVFSAPTHPADERDCSPPPTVLIKLKNFNNAIQNNISSRTWMAIALACLIYRKELELPFDLVTKILSFVQSGYETRSQLAKIGFFSHKLAICARDTVAKHDTPPSATSVPRIIPKGRGGK